MKCKGLYITLLILASGCSSNLYETSDSAYFGPPPTEKSKQAVKRSSVSMSNQQGGTKFFWAPDDDEDEYIIEISGVHPIDFSIESEERKAMFNRNNNAIKFYSRSQYHLYKKDYDSAMYWINSSIEMVESSEALALKGSILYIKGLTIDARSYWKRALLIDSTLVIPQLNTENKD